MEEEEGNKNKKNYYTNSNKNKYQNNNIQNNFIAKKEYDWEKANKCQLSNFDF